MKKHLRLLFICCLLVITSTAQRKTILERVSTYSSVGPAMQYLRMADTRQKLIENLNETLNKHGYGTIADTSVPVQELILNRNNPVTSSLSYTPADTTTDHLYLDVLEIQPYAFFLQHPEYKEETELIKRSKSLFQLNILIIDHQKQKRLANTLIVSVADLAGEGIGIRVPNILMSPRSFSGLLKVGFDFMLDPASDRELIEIKVPPVFYADNFILPSLHDYTVYNTKPEKDFFTFTLQQKNQILRMGESYYEELAVRGKKSNVPENSTLGKNIQATGRSRSSDFVRLRQECRDVVANKNYSVQLFSEVNPNIPYSGPMDIFSYFLPGYHHILLNDTDTLAIFTITKGEGKTDQRYYLNRITNGIDSNSTTILSPTDVARTMFYEYTMYGKLKDIPFIIRCSNNGLKEILYNEQRVIIATGTNLPERFAVFDASLTPDTINQLLILAFNKFFQQ
jgi:hypothetical protein